MDEERQDETAQIRSWHAYELRRLNFTRAQREFLLAEMDAGRLELSEVRDYVEKRGWTPEQAFLAVA